MSNYSHRPKSEHVRFSDVGLLFGCKSVRISKSSDNRTNLFGFQTFVYVQNPNKLMFERSVFGQTAKLGRFIYKDRPKKNSYLYKTV